MYLTGGGGSYSRSGIDSDLEAFSHNPADGSFVALPRQTAPKTNIWNRISSRTKRYYQSPVDIQLLAFLKTRYLRPLKSSAHNFQQPTESNGPQCPAPTRHIQQPILSNGPQYSAPTISNGPRYPAAHDVQRPTVSNGPQYPAPTISSGT